MPKFLEEKLKQEYGADSKIPYKVMNAKGLMHGNKETAKGRALQAKHNRDTKHKKKKHRGAMPAQLARGKIMKHFKKRMPPTAGVTGGGNY